MSDAKIETWLEMVTMPEDDEKCGIMARVVTHNWTTGNRRTYESGGVFGIGSDIDYHWEVFKQELENLKAEFVEELKGINAGYPVKRLTEDL